MRFFAFYAAWLAAFCILNVLLRRVVDALPPLSPAALPGLLLSPALWAAGVLYVACAGLYAAAMGSAPLSIVGPVFLATGVAATSLLGWAVFGEALSGMRALGLGVIGAGIAILVLEGLR